MNVNGDRIAKLIKMHPLSRAEIAKKMGVKYQDLGNWIFRDVFPDPENLYKLAAILGVDSESLIIENELAEPQPFYAKKIAYSTDDLIPFYETDPHIGLSEIWKGTFEIYPKDHFYLPGISADLVLSYYGRGLEPQLENGDWIVLRKVTDFTFFNYGNIHAIVTKEHVIVRTLNKGKNEQTVLLSALDNQKDSIELPKKAIQGLFAIITVIKRKMI